MVQVLLLWSGTLLIARPLNCSQSGNRRRVLRATLDWINVSGAAFDAGPGYSDLAHLRHYSARYGVWGEGPPLVVVPGLAGGFELLGPLVRCLASSYRVITYQLRGEDDAFALRRRFGLSDLVDDLEDFLSWCDLERPPILGVSFGGILALELALRRPSRLQALVVQGVGARLQRGLLQQVAGTILSRFPLPADSPFINQFFNLLFGRRQPPGALVDFVTTRCWQTDQSVMAHRFRLVESFDVTRRSGGVRVPTLALAGERDVLVPPQSLQELTQALPEVQCARLPQCGHLAFVTHPERVAAEVHQFLKRQQC